MYFVCRRCWRKDGLDLLLDPSFFAMDYESLKCWRTTTDNLMTHDKTTFKVSMYIYYLLSLTAHQIHFFLINK